MNADGEEEPTVRRSTRARRTVKESLAEDDLMQMQECEEEEEELMLEAEAADETVMEEVEEALRSRRGRGRNGHRIRQGELEEEEMVDMNDGGAAADMNDVGTEGGSARGRRRRGRHQGEEEGDEEQERRGSNNEDGSDEESEEEADIESYDNLSFDPDVSTAANIVAAEAFYKQQQNAHRRRVTAASIEINPRRAWSCLSKTQKNHLGVVLFFLKQDVIPDELKWDDGWGGFERSFHTSITSNKEVFFARLDNAPGLENYKDRAYPIAKALRGDAEVMLELCERSPHSLMLATSALKDNHDFVMEAIQSDPAAFKFSSARLRKDKRTIRKVLGMPGGIRAFMSLHNKFQRDEKLALFAVKRAGAEYAKSHEHLVDLPGRYRNDEEIVLEAVKQRGSNIKYITDESLKMNISVVDAACRNDGSVWQYLPPSPARAQMLETKSDLTNILSSGLGSCLDEAPPALQKDRDLILLAVQNGYASKRLGKFFGQDQKFFFQLVGASNQIASFYKELPVILQQDPKVATAVVNNSSLCDEAMLLIAEHTDGDLLNEDLIKAVVQKGLLKVLETRPLEALMCRKDFVMDLIKIDGGSLLHASRELKADMECILTALKDSNKRASVRDLAAFIPEDKWNIATSLITIIRATEGAPRDDEAYLRGRISNDMFMKINVYLACIKAGWLTNYLPWQAQNRHSSDGRVQLETIKAKLKRGVPPRNLDLWRLHNAKRETIKEIIPLYPGIVQRSRRFGSNFGLRLTAVAHSREALMSFDHGPIKKIKDIMNFAEKVREKKAELDTFLYTFFGAMLIQSPPPKKKSRKGKKGQKSICHLPMLGLGGGAGVTIKKKITEYAGTKFGDYAKLRKADEYLALYGY